MPAIPPSPDDAPDRDDDRVRADGLDRRGFLDWSTRGIGATALLSLLLRDGAVHADEATPGNVPGAASSDGARPHLRPRARRAIHVCLVGGLSHVDSFDPKPALDTHHGQSLKTTDRPDVFFGQVGLLRRSDFAFAPRGESGLEISDLFPHLAAQADRLTVLRSLVSESANHTPALFVANSGFQANGFPSLGSWLSYGLGSEADSLPAYVVLPDGRGDPNTGSSTWDAAFLPGRHQGVVFRGGPQPVADLFPARTIRPDEEQDVRGLLRLLDQRQQERSAGDALFAARLRSYELAARMQQAVPEATDLSEETRETHALYGLDDRTTSDAARRCLLARRLIERGVRFVQIFSGGPIAGSPRASWDAHENVRQNHAAEAARIDRPVAGLLGDLARRGLLDDTLVLFTTEFGRTPVAQSAANQVGPGRDHNRYGFSCWLAGGGAKPGIAVGATDELGWKAVERPIPWHDLHATVLHLFGIDHERLTFYHNGIARRLTNVHGEVVAEAVA
jgi:uncharacterized protein (DUF1501 family)